jgi:2-polyprenyl-3-methyl-5-hydroxy-6-metoxy-1,4-benzoquinol methylase
MSFSFNFAGPTTPPDPPPPPPAAAPPPAAPHALQLLPFPPPNPSLSFTPLPGYPRLQRAVPPDADAISGARAVDVIPGLYEGGAKVWECTADLLLLLGSPALAARLRGARVLDLGCGGGLLGAAALLGGAAEVTLQDLNAPVLLRLAAPNVSRNAGAAAAARVALLAGGWEAMLGALRGEGAAEGGCGDAGAHLRRGFDVVLSSETLYREEAHATVAALLAALLRPGGVALLAAKRFYFGVGGGTRRFMASAAPAAGLRCEVVAVVEDGRSNVREVLRVERG